MKLTSYGMNSIFLRRYIGAVIIFFLLLIGNTYAGLIDDLKQKIDSKGSEITALEQEIAKYEQEITSLGNETKTLATSIKVLDITQKKLEADIHLTQSKIAAENLEIERLQIDIASKQDNIEQDLRIIGGILRGVEEIGSKSLTEVILSNDTFTQFWDDIENLGRLEKSIQEKVKDLQDLKAARESDKLKTEQRRQVLVNLKNQLSDQQRVVKANKDEKNKLLALTKNKESNYKKILEKKRALKEAFETELRQFESELKIAIDPNSLPQKGSGVLSWPLDNVRITQYFGNTDFARSGAYNGKGHNGIDLAASYGTRIKASLSGTVIGTGDTDRVCPGASYGRWVLIKHRDGLSTLYAHLSVINVSTGQEINTGGIIGYSGDTGYATGPHLHFTVYATQGVSIEQRKSTVCGGTYTLPIAPLNAYLDPIDYLKKLQN